MDTPTAELEIAIHRWDAGRHTVELRFRRPDSDADISPARGLTRFDTAALLALALDPDAYGKELSRQLFAVAEVHEQLEQARAVTEAKGWPLRLRLFIGPSAPELQSLLWETLTDPRTGRWLLTQETLFFSRHMSSYDWRPVQRRPRSALRALAAVASPEGLGGTQPGSWALSPIDAAGELNRARKGLGDIPVATLEPGTRVTLPAIGEALRAEQHDIVYLVCHGALRNGEAWLFLEDEEGKVARVDGDALVAQIGDMEHRPLLVVLASCESMGTGASADDGGALLSLGPRLAEAGVPAVLAMQGSVSMATLEAFLPVFFHELQQDGQIDRAAAVARGAVRDRADRFMPVLFLRLGSGRIWYDPGFGHEGGLEKWPALLNNIARGRCTPILGSGLLEPIIGSSREIARRWAEGHHFPMAPHERDDLPQVAQYLAIVQEESYLRDTLVLELQRELRRRYARVLPDKPSGKVEQLVSDLRTVGEVERRTNPADPHQVLAALPFPLYISTNPDSFLADALTAAGRTPQVELCRWRDDVAWPPSVFADRATDYQPTPEKPLVYHLFGRFQEPDSIVLTEDNYFDYLIRASRQGQDSPHPPVVLQAQITTALLFLGFRMEDWDFRVFFRSLRGREGSALSQRLSHVAVQIDPEENRLLDPDRARKYLQQYVGSKVSIYWGSVHDFMRELREQWQRREAGP